MTGRPVLKLPEYDLDEATAAAEAMAIVAPRHQVEQIRAVTSGGFGPSLNAPIDNEWERRYGDRQALAAQLGEDCCAGHRKHGWKIAHCVVACWIGCERLRTRIPPFSLVKKE